MKKFKLTIITTCTDAYYESRQPIMKSQIDSGEVKQKFLTDKDKQDGVIDVEITSEELPL